MPITVATHYGKFHADDVLAWALIQRFLDTDAVLVRTREPQLLDSADLVFDVGGIFDATTRRFDHHQKSYGGPLSSAGMVLNWMESQGHVGPGLAGHLRRSLVDYVDLVDTGVLQPDPSRPCFATLVDLYNKGCSSLPEFDAAFLEAGAMALGVVRGLVREFDARQADRVRIQAALADAERRDSNLLCLDLWFDWKGPYYDLGGAEHATQFVLQPDLNGETWRVVAIPPERGSFDKKLPLPLRWAGLVDEELVEETGVPGAKFCHKNRFICVWDSREGALRAVTEAGLITGSVG
jgi:uncharacterized UPF0160 family protein